MRRRHFAGLILASTLITFDGTAVTLALPAIGQDLSIPVSRLQWIANAPLLMLAAVLLPAGTLADRYGRVRVMRIGLALFALASVLCAIAQGDVWLIVTRAILGAGGALVLPAALAVLRGECTDPLERTRMFGVWAAWTGAAAAAGPLLAGAVLDFLSWRAIFIPTALGAAIAAVLLEPRSAAASATHAQPVPVVATLALVGLLGGTAYVLMYASTGELDWTAAPAAGIAAAGGFGFLRNRQRRLLLPQEVVTSPNCLPANAATFALYFGMFGLSFLIALYVQQVLGHSAFRAAVLLLPMSLMLLLAEPLGRLTARFGTRFLIGAGVLIAAAGLGWIGTGPDPLPFWSRIFAGTAVFGLGVSLAVSSLTHAAVAAVPETWAGAASGLNHATVRAAGLLSVALLGSIAAPGFSDAVSADGVRRAVIVCGAVVAIGGLAASARLRDEAPGGLTGAN
jgi:MFS family permease